MMQREPSLLMILLPIAGFILGMFVSLNILSTHYNLNLWNEISVYGDSASKFKALVIISPIVSFFVGHWMSSMIMLIQASQGVDPRHPKFVVISGLAVVFVNILIIGFFVNFVFDAHIFQNMTDKIGLWKFRGIYHLVSPLAGSMCAYFGARIAESMNE